jgi:hypothetical protein
MQAITAFDETLRRPLRPPEAAGQLKACRLLQAGTRTGYFEALRSERWIMAV